VTRVVSDVYELTLGFFDEHADAKPRIHGLPAWVRITHSAQGLTALQMITTLSVLTGVLRNARYPHVSGRNHKGRSGSPS